MRPAPDPNRRVAAFTLFEMLAVVFLTGLVLTVAVDFYLDLSWESTAATERVGEARRGLTLLDRVERDLRGTVLLVRPPEMDPLEHPWVFLAEAREASEGADRVKFVTRSHRPRSGEAHESDLAIVSYTTARGEAGDQVLLRHVSPRLPESLDRNFPRDDEALVLAEGLDHFGMRFLTENGDWTARFDSSTLAYSNQLPVSVEIELAFAVENADGFLEAGPGFSRVVSLPLRPLDLQALKEEQEGAQSETENEEGEEEEGACTMTVGECSILSPTVAQILDALEPSVRESVSQSCFDTEQAANLGVSVEECLQ